MNSPLVENAREVFELREQKKTLREIGARFGVSNQAVSQFLKPKHPNFVPPWQLWRQVVWLRSQGEKFKVIADSLFAQADAIAAKIKGKSE